MKIELVVMLIINLLIIGSCKKNDGIEFEYYPDGNLKRKYVYNNGQEIYYKSYTEDGKLKGSRIKINVTANKENFHLNDSLILSIKPAYSEGNALTAIIGPLNDNGFLESEKFWMVSDSLNIIYSTKLNKKGKFVFSGILLESYSKGDTVFNGSCKYLPDAGSDNFKFDYEVL